MKMKKTAIALLTMLFIAVAATGAEPQTAPPTTGGSGGGGGTPPVGSCADYVFGVIC